MHERLHAHRGLAAVQAGTIARKEYTALLARLYGFHRPFELAAQVSRDRTLWLESDLAVMGIDLGDRSALPLCPLADGLASPEFVLGARYVVEGSALGGRGLAKQLDGLLGSGTLAGRRFFSGYGTETATIWHDYLGQLSTAPEAAHIDIVTGATWAFAMFEHWLDGWNDEHA